ncbi:hypothetical protein AYK26_04240 [Euryarchaeota archaeon SM23-78]|nr:MAG: hypothetical protein AYK26_04240 [Euryarchaeota archaeon SM23-78]MBW3001274.1 FHA domain-containing protein [Candidatus Woesearchaeota archaeon]
MFFKHEEEEPIAYLTGFEGAFKITKQVTTIGSSTDNDIVIPSPYISKRHARIIYDLNTNSFVFEDSSLCGTRVDMLGRIRHKKVPLKDDDALFFWRAGFGFHPVMAVLVDPNDINHILPRTRPIVIGRQGDILVDQKYKFYVSNKHAVIKYNLRRRKYFIRDMDSHTGTFVNKRRAGKRLGIALKDGDEISFGTSKQDHNLFFKFVHYAVDKKKKIYLKSFEHEPDMSQILKSIEDGIFHDDLEFSYMVKGILESHGFVKAGYKWFKGGAGGWIRFGKGDVDKIFIFPNAVSDDEIFDPACQRYFKVFIQPDKEGFFAVFNQLILTLDKNFDIFDGKVNASGQLVGKEDAAYNENIVLYLRPRKTDDFNKLGPDYYHDKALQVIEILKKGLSSLEEHGFGGAPYTEPVTRLIHYRQGGRYLRTRKNVNLHFFMPPHYALFNIGRINKLMKKEKETTL